MTSDDDDNVIIIPIKALKDGTSLDAKELVCTVSYPDNVPTPKGHLRSQMRLHNLWHRATYIVVTYQDNNNNNNNNNRDDDDTTKIIVQKRSQLKDFGPGLLDPSPGGVVGYGETYEDNAKREIQEEMGINIIINDNDNNNYNINTLTKLFNLFIKMIELKYLVNYSNAS